MKETNCTDMSIEEIETLIVQNKKKMNLLQDKEKNFAGMLNLFDDLSKTQKQYYDYKMMLRSPLFELTAFERETMENLIPIFEQKIDNLKDSLQNIKPSEVF